jgi:chemotaxis family two-component system sensor kinase Cph1
VSVAYRPADGPAAGGDFYDVFALSDGRVAIVLGDVSGHGRAALARAAQKRYTLRAYVEAGLKPRAALRLAGSVLGTVPDDLFTTAAIAVHDPSTASLTYATAATHSPS